MKIKRWLSSLLVMTIMILSIPSIDAKASGYDPAAVGGLFSGKYGKYQVFDVQRSPAYPGGTQASPASFTVSSFRKPNGVSSSITEEGWFYFKGVGSAAATKISYGSGWNCAAESIDPYIVELWYNDNHGHDAKCSTGVIGGIATEGFFYEGDSHWGFYFSNNAAYEYGHDSLTYTPMANGRVAASVDTLKNYKAGSMLVPEGFFKVTLDPGEGTGEAITYPAKKVTFYEPSFTAPAGKEFDCWKNGDKTYKPGDTLTLTANATFVAQWKSTGSESGSEDITNNPDGTRTITEVKQDEKGSKYIIVTTYDKADKPISKYIYQLAKGGSLDLKKVNINIKKVVVPATVKANGKTYKVTRIKKNFMKKCKKATRLSIGKNVNRIDKGALNGGKKLRVVTIKGKLKKVGKGAFKAMKKGTIRLRVNKKNYEKNRELLEKSGINPNVTIKRVRPKIIITHS